MADQLPQSIQQVDFKKLLITPSGLSAENKALNATDAIVAIDYYEDLLSPSVTCKIMTVQTELLFM